METEMEMVVTRVNFFEDWQRTDKLYMVPEQVAPAEHEFYDTVVCSTYLIPAVVCLFRLY